MSEANEDRGEHSLRLGEKDYRLRPTFDAIRAIEKKTGQSVVGLSRLGYLGNMDLDTIGIIGAELIRAGATEELDRQVSADRIAELAYEAGAPHVMARLTLCLVDAATGGRTATGEAKAAEATFDPATAA